MSSKCRPVVGSSNRNSVPLPLRLAARERGHRLTEPHIFQADIDDGLQRADDLAVAGKALRGLAHGEVQHVGHAHAVAVAGDGDLQDLGPVTAAVAVRAAQVHVAQELHLHMLEAGAAAGGAAPVAAVEAELGRRVAALAGQRRVGEQGTDGVPGAHIAHRVGARRLADGRLVHKHHVAQLLGAQQAVVRAGRFGGLAEVAHERGCQHVLHQAGLAGAGHAGHHHQPLQRNLHRHVLQVVLARAFQDEARRAVGHRPLEAHADGLAATEVRAGEGVGVADGTRRAVEHDLPAPLAGAGAHVDQAVGGQHDGGVVLDHHQRVAGVAQAQHGVVDAGHVARVQADAGFVQHEQGVDQGGAERGGEVDALDFAATEGAALAVEGEVADADFAEVAQAGVDFGEQEAQGLLLSGHFSSAGGGEETWVGGGGLRRPMSVGGGYPGRRFGLAV